MSLPGMLNSDLRAYGSLSAEIERVGTIHYAPFHFLGIRFCFWPRRHCRHNAQEETDDWLGKQVYGMSSTQQKKILMLHYNGADLDAKLIPFITEHH
jgi:hypothetical protein